MKWLSLRMKLLFLKLSLKLSMDDHTKDSKKSPYYQFQLLLIRMFLAIRHVEIDPEEKITMKTLLHIF
jgi:hypothetical protein